MKKMSKPNTVGNPECERYEIGPNEHYIGSWPPPWYEKDGKYFDWQTDVEIEISVKSLEELLKETE